MILNLLTIINTDFKSGPEDESTKPLKSCDPETNEPMTGAPPKTEAAASDEEEDMELGEASLKRPKME